MNFPSIDIQGAILSSEILAKIRTEAASFQQGKDFGVDLINSKLKDEISLAWQDAKAQWNIFKNRLSRLDEGETAATETRNFWITPLLTNLGYNLVYSRQAEEINGRSFPIRFRDTNRDNFPVYVCGYHESLDRRPENKTLRVSPHALMQEYLNYSEHLYGLVTNGHQLRLLRDASRITRLSYVEFNLEKIMEEDLYPDFVILYRLLHASRMPVKMDAGAESIMEQYHQESLEVGSTIRNKLGDAVKSAIIVLANGFVNHPNNSGLWEIIKNNQFDRDVFYRHLLRIIYRLLFLFVIEERNLVYSNTKSTENKRFAQIYFEYFSLFRLRKLARSFPPPEAERHYDLWRGLLNTFSLYESKEAGEKLGIMALRGDLFSYNAISNGHYDLHECDLSNAVLLNIIRSLTYFENENRVLSAVNYGGLDVEEFGSVYEGLLELKLKCEPIVGSDGYRCSFEGSSERSRSGSHYTPDELVQPLIKHSLDYLIEDKLKEKDPEAALLSLKVADVACGSGHILLAAARRIALELAKLQETRESNSKEKVEQPSPLYVRKALKQVIKSCIYGVDKNPLAVELCKIALWLESYNPGEPLSFLDHRIKCGDAIVGLAHRSELEAGIPDEAFKTLPNDDKNLAKTFRDKNKEERKERKAQSVQLKAEFDESTIHSVQEAFEEYKTFNQLPETTPEEIERKAKAYQKFIGGKGYTFLKAMADTQIAQFFIPKTEANKDYLMTDADFRLILSGYKGWQDRKVAKATALAYQQKFFHWFLEFPEVFAEGKNPELAEGSNGGFDCILGNPPFLGGQKLSGSFGDAFLKCIKYEFAPIGAVDLVTYFFRRIFGIIKAGGFQSLISTNTIAQGKAREDGLDVIVKNGGSINFAIKSTKWPGVAAVEVALVTITKQNWKGKFYLGTKEVKTITPYLDDAETLGNPFPLKQNEGKSFQGSIVLGKGFVLEPQEAKALIAKDPRNKEVLFPYLNGDDLNNNPDQSPSRWVINFFDWSEEKAKTYPDCYQIVERLVKPERLAYDENKNSWNKSVKENWWLFGAWRKGLDEAIAHLERVLVISEVTKYCEFSYSGTDLVFMHTLKIITLNKKATFLIMNSIIHCEWAWSYSSTMGGVGLRYILSSAFETFPFPQNLGAEKDQQLETIGEAYHEHRRQLMLDMQLGLTKTYNQFHNEELKMNNEEWGRLLEALDNGKSLAAINLKDYHFGKESVNLIKHFQKGAPTISLREAVAGIEKLRALHVQMDQAVLEAYGWSDIQLRHDFYEVDYLPENDRIRYTIHPDARKEILKRLLELNHQIHAREIAAGLWDKKGKKKNVDGIVSEPDVDYGLFKKDKR